MPHSPAVNFAVGWLSRPAYEKLLSFCASARLAICVTTSGLSISSFASGPPRPFASDAIGRLCQALKFSICVQLIQAEVKPHGAPAARNFFATSKVSGQVFGGLFGSSPAFSNNCLFQ